ncbi:recombinase family protein [Paenirhodobacter populi]
MALRVAIYARYSTDMQNPTSCEDQIRQCREYAERMGWSVSAVYEDSAISGSHVILRPGVQRMIQGGRARKFDIVLAEGMERISRGQADIASIYDNMTFAGVKIITLQEGEITQMLIGFKGTMNAATLADLSTKTHRGLRGRIEAGKSGGGNAYGYRVLRSLTEDGELKRRPRDPPGRSRRRAADLPRLSRRGIAKQDRRHAEPGRRLRPARWQMGQIHHSRQSEARHRHPEQRTLHRPDGLEPAEVRQGSPDRQTLGPAQPARGMDHP